jgi:hypothetical protein
MYAKMPFRLMNARATFQRAMDVAFVGEKDKFVLIYLDEITVYSNSHKEHLKNLKRVFSEVQAVRNFIESQKVPFCS